MCEAFDQNAELCADEQASSLPPSDEAARAASRVHEHGVPRD
jgi:hypothetical protein